MYYTYVLYSPRFSKIYVGFSDDLRDCLQIHNDSKNTSWTGKFQPWELFYSEEFTTKSDAIEHEKQLNTSRGRVSLWAMVKPGKK